MVGDSAHSRSQVWRRSVLLLVILLGASLRLYRLGAQSLWYDEGVTAMVARMSTPELLRWTAADIQPPLYYLAVGGWGRLIGWSEWGLRSLSLGWGVLGLPLLAALAQRLTRSRLTALLAALIGSLHPLLIYYSQEARMYTMLLALGLVAAHAALGFLRHEQRSLRAAGSFVLAATAAVYTHYFAFFLLLAIAIAGLVDQRRRSLSRLGLFVALNLLVLLLYAPWLQVLFDRLAVDRSYWPGAFKLGEALWDIVMRFSLGETVLEAEALRFIWISAGATAVALISLLTTFGGTERPAVIRYALIMLLVPVAAVLALASAAPKFNPRYVLIALPGLILLWSGGLARLLSRIAIGWPRPQGKACSVQPRMLPVLVGIVTTGLLLSGFLYADGNWYFDPAFTKDQWRAVAAHVRTHYQPGDRIVLVSGHAAPVWRYYAPDLDPIRLPNIDVLDVDAVLGFADTAPALRNGLNPNASVWLVGWQDNIVDPMEIVPLQLSRAGEERPVDAGFWGLTLRRFALERPDRIEAEPPIEQTAGILFGRWAADAARVDTVVELLGHRLERNGDLLLFWHLPVETELDLFLSGRTETASGAPYARLQDRRLGGYDYPAFRWPSGTTAVTRIPAADWLGGGAPAADYHIWLGVYAAGGDPAGLDVLGTDGRALGKRTRIQVTLPSPLPQMVGSETGWVAVTDDVRVRAQLQPAVADAGQPLLLTVHWLAERPIAVDVLHLAWRTPIASEVVTQTLAVDLVLPAGGSVRTVHRVTPQLSPRPSPYRLLLTLDNRITGRDGDGPVLASVDLLPSARSFVLPQINRELALLFANEIELVGMLGDLPATIDRGAPLTVPLVWRAAASPVTDYAVTIQLLGEEGRPLAQRDVPLAGGSGSWIVGQVVTQTVTLDAPTRPGAYQLIAAIYDGNRPDLPRLTLEDGSDAAVLGTVRVE